jgi:ABC-2 type transport system permease protein
VYGFVEADTKMMAVSVVIAYCMILCSPCSASISLEGKNLWILKSMPVDEKTIFMGKLGLGLVVTIPIGILSSIIIYIALGLSFVQWLVILLLTIACGMLSSTLGLMVNLMFPKIEFKSPTEVVKQSAASGISIFAGMFIVIITMILGSLFQPQSITLYVLFVSIAYLLLSAVCWYYITHKGVKVFKGL